MFPMNCIPRGILFFSPNGTDVAGKPPRFAGIVKISCLYISTGSVIEPKSKASPDVVGNITEETSLNALTKSLEIRFLIFCAFL